jgi:hypothetical protein
MALPNVGGGWQIDDGNLNEINLNTTAPVQTATVTATLTVAQLLGNILVGNPSTSAAAYTLPLVSDLEATLTNAKVGSSFELTIINIGTSSGVITVTTNTGWTLVGKVTIPITSSDGSSVTWTALKTGAGAWSFYNCG